MVASNTQQRRKTFPKEILGEKVTFQMFSVERRVYFLGEKKKE